eukprot:5913905-Pyramimonas_sp.AAC.1
MAGGAKLEEVVNTSGPAGWNRVLRTDDVADVGTHLQTQDSRAARGEAGNQLVDLVLQEMTRECVVAETDTHVVRFCCARTVALVRLPASDGGSRSSCPRTP